MRRRTETTDADRERFELLFDRHRRAVLGYALRRVEQPADAADVLAETFLVAWRRLEDVPDGAAGLPWLLAVARRVLANQRRGRRRRDGLAERLRGELTAALPAHTGALGGGEGERGEPGRLATALARLSEADREIVLLAGWEELEPAQIAVVLGIGGEAARTRLHRARARLRDALAATDPDRASAPRAATPPASSPRAASPAAASPPAADAPAASPRAASPRAASPRAATPPASSARAASPPASSPPAASPLAVDARAASPLASSPRAAGALAAPAPHADAARRGATPPRPLWPATDLPKESL